MPTRFVLNPTFKRELLVSHELATGVLEPLVRDVETAAKRLARKRTHELERGIEGIVGISDGQYIGRVVAKDFKSGWWEFGYKSKPAGSPFLRPALSEVLPGAAILGGGHR